MGEADTSVREAKPLGEGDVGLTRNVERERSERGGRAARGCEMGG